MGLFGWFRSAPFEDPELGTLVRAGGRWNGTITFGPHRDVPLRLRGDGKAPDPAALALARALPARFGELRTPIAAALHEHYEPYRDADVAGPRIDRPDDVWPHVTPVHVLVGPLGGSPAPGPIVEIAFEVAWDEEHTVAARIQDGRVFELCGSV